MIVRRHRHEDERPIPAHPYRDAALVYAAMAGLLVAIALLTGGNAAKAVLVAGGFFVLATGWAWGRLRLRIRRRSRRQAAAEARVGGGVPVRPDERGGAR